MAKKKEREVEEPVVMDYKQIKDSYLDKKVHDEAKKKIHRTLHAVVNEEFENVLNDGKVKNASATAKKIETALKKLLMEDLGISDSKKDASQKGKDIINQAAGQVYGADFKSLKKLLETTNYDDFTEFYNQIISSSKKQHTKYMLNQAADKLHSYWHENRDKHIPEFFKGSKGDVGPEHDWHDDYLKKFDPTEEEAGKLVELIHGNLSGDLSPKAKKANYMKELKEIQKPEEKKQKQYKMAK